MVRDSNGWDQVFWEQDDQWPKGDRRHVFLAAAVHEAGAAMFGPEWSGSEPREGVDFDPVELQFVLADPKAALKKQMLADLNSERVSSRPISNVEADRLKAAAPKYFYHRLDWHVIEWKQEMRCREMVANIHRSFASFGRLVDVCEWIAARGRDADLITLGRWKTGGEYFDLPPSIWNTEPAWERLIRECEVERFAELGPGQLSQAYLFLERESLTRSLSSLDFPPEAPVAPVAPAPAEVLSALDAEPPRRGRGRRSGVGGFVPQDDALVEEIVAIVRAERIAPWAATKRFIDRIEGYTPDEDNKIKRVVKRYYKRFDAYGNPVA